MSNELLRRGQKPTIEYPTRARRAMVKSVNYRFHLNVPHGDQEAGALTLHKSDRVQLGMTAPPLCEPYFKNRSTDSLSLIGTMTNGTFKANVITPDRRKHT